MSLRRLIPFVILVFLLILPARSARAWGEDGHRIIASMAEQRLSTNARRAVRRLIGRQSLADISTWADEIKGQRPATKEWHYVDIPFTASAYDPQRDCHNGDCVVSAIERFTAQVNDPKLSRAQRAEALKYLVHFIADIHQPLHAGTRADSRGRDDRGGNERSLRYRGRLTNLHRFWDIDLVKLAMGDQDLPTFASRLQVKIRQADAATWSDAGAAQWASESHRVAVHVAYNGLSADGPPIPLTGAYLDSALPAVQRQMQIAAVRLAASLNAAFP